MRKSLSLAVALISFSSLASAATLTSLNSTQAKNVISDKTITTVSTVTLDGKLVDNTFTGYFNKDGTMQGSFATKPDNGPQTDQGKWRVMANGDFCFTWQNWDNNKERCVTFYKLNNALLVINNGNKFETLILDNNIQPGNKLS